ncbi:hypothetical protein GF339_00120 [candidate division KSB3 bacterium]|uniref:Bacteriophage T5 Orf172 DNA-binding domain-containing protein n=1 Tax=candidate division KSB3 bacterium TaxID=2044937 RepID=A0A9D5JRJ6_9BACT|nr:hypothetical protein [candidate division KSB3 bacterium]MBD3322953.1 hypothetical protein [candidate division KSB3 bacterium]
MLEYRTRYPPPSNELFWKMLRFEGGRYEETPSKRVWLEIPRIEHITNYTEPVPMYAPSNTFFHVRGRIVGQTPKQERRARTQYDLEYDTTDPIFCSFLDKIYHPAILLPYSTSKKSWNPIRLGGKTRPFLSYWTLPSHQITTIKFQKLAKQREKKEKAAQRKRERLKKAGIEYKPSTPQEKANQVYIIQMTMQDASQDSSPVYKIGISNAPGKRLQALQTSSPFPLSLVHTFVAEPAEEAERVLHAKYQAHQLNGEWFQLLPEHIQELKHIVQYDQGEFLTDSRPEN